MSPSSSATQVDDALTEKRRYAVDRCQELTLPSESVAPLGWDVRRTTLPSQSDALGRARFSPVRATSKRHPHVPTQRVRGALIAGTACAMGAAGLYVLRSGAGSNQYQQEHPTESHPPVDETSIDQGDRLVHVTILMEMWRSEARRTILVERRRNNSSRTSGRVPTTDATDGLPPWRTFGAPGRRSRPSLRKIRRRRWNRTIHRSPTVRTPPTIPGQRRMRSVTHMRPAASAVMSRSTRTARRPALSSSRVVRTHRPRDTPRIRDAT